MKIEEIENSEKFQRLKKIDISFDRITDEEVATFYFEMMALSILWRSTKKEPKQKNIRKFLIELNEFYRRHKEMIPRFMTKVE